MINTKDLEKYPNRQKALAIIEAGLSAIDTKRVVRSTIILQDEVLKIKDLEINLKDYKKIKIIGFGKASSEAALALEEVLGSRISGGVTIDIKSSETRYIESLVGDHPHPSMKNVLATEKVIESVKGLTEDDLVLVIVSGGGSALLCWPEEECNQGEMLYSNFLKVGGTIEELNIVRKHLSLIKGGGLAKLLHPARVVGLIFCDVPGGNAEEVASGPTSKDTTTTEDAKKILNKYGFEGFKLNETPKEDKYFERVTNISLVSNLNALEAMALKAQELGFEAKILSSKIYSLPEETINDFKKLLTKNTVVLGGGEVKLVIKGEGGSGGRCVQLALASLKHLEADETFSAIASDGIDNSDTAGAIVDKNTLEIVSRLNLDIETYLERVDSYNFFKQTGDLVFTGPTGANVSDLMLWIKE